MIKIKQAIIVEGKYDKIKLETILDATIISTDGFRIFKDKELLLMIKAIAEKNGIIILTDSDVAGFKIRRYLCSAIDKQFITQVYIPQIKGKEKRKEKASKEGFLGVEGVKKQDIIDAFTKSKIIFNESSGETTETKVTKIDLFEDGLSGGENAAQKRQAFIKKLNLPSYLSANSLLTVINTMLTFEEYKEIIQSINQTEI